MNEAIWQFFFSSISCLFPQLIIFQATGAGWHHSMYWGDGRKMWRHWTNGHPSHGNMICAQCSRITEMTVHNNHTDLHFKSCLRS